MGVATIKINDTVIRLVKATQLRVDPNYQRPLDKQRAKRIASKFNWAAFGVPLVTESVVKGVYDLCNGQHRVEGLLIHFKEELEGVKIPVQVVAEEPEDAFEWANDEMKPVHPVYRFKCRYSRGKRLNKPNNATLIVDTLNRYGIGVKFEKSRPRIGDTNAPYAFALILDKVGEKNFDEAVSIFRYAFSRPEGEKVETAALSPDFIKGMAKFIEHTPHSIGTIKEALIAADVSSEDMVKAAKLKKQDESRWRIYEYVAKELNAAMKKGLKALKV